MTSCCFVASGNENIGMGHIMRTIAISNAMVEKDIQVKFVTKYDYGKAFLKSKGFDVLSYNAVFDLRNKFENYDFIIIDDYEVNRELFNFFKQYCKYLIYIDDLNMFDYNVDMVVNTSIGAENIDYNFNSTKKYLLGAKYCILRDEFRNINKRVINTNVKDILITTGGSDSHNMTLTLLNFLINKFSNLKYHVIIGYAFKNVQSINELSNQNNNIIIYNSPSNMAEIMNKCDIAISAGGNTLYELCRCQVPAIALITADNQINFVKNFEFTECIKSIGMWDCIDYNYFYSLLKTMLEYSFRKQMADKQYKLIDGNGVYRIVDSILGLER